MKITLEIIQVSRKEGDKMETRFDSHECLSAIWCQKAGCAHLGRWGGEEKQVNGEEEIEDSQRQSRKEQHRESCGLEEIELWCEHLGCQVGKKEWKTVRERGRERKKKETEREEGTERMKERERERRGRSERKREGKGKRERKKER